MSKHQLEEPVAGLGLRYDWQRGDWETLFDAQIRLIQRDILRARLDGKLIVYLSCPISARGGGHGGTNVEIAKFTERRLLAEWGERFWILNPCQYQLESKEGHGLMNLHADEARIDLKDLPPATGADYMRMWTKVLVEDAWLHPSAKGSRSENSGRHLDAFYFQGPSDTHTFFRRQGDTLSAGIEGYFARRHAFDSQFREDFTVKSLAWGRSPNGDDAESPSLSKQKAEWDELRVSFLRYYSLRASVSYSLGSHDEWLIFVLLNRRRRALPAAEGAGIPGQIAGFFDGRQIDPASAEGFVSAGYGSIELR